MDWNAIGAMGEVIGATAVVISLIYVALQVRQNTASSKSTVETEIALAMASVALDPANSGLAGPLLRGYSEPSALSDDERSQFYLYLVGWLRVAQLAFDQHRAGNLSRDSWESIEVSVRVQVTTPGFREFWGVRGAYFKASFREFIGAFQAAASIDDEFSKSMEFLYRDK